MRAILTSLVLLFSLCLTMTVSAQSNCACSKDPEAQKYFNKTQAKENVQSCSQCATLALYLCMATYSENAEKQPDLINKVATLRNSIQLTGEPICCPELLTSIIKFNTRTCSGGTAPVSAGAVKSTPITASSASLKGSANATQLAATAKALNVDEEDLAMARLLVGSTQSLLGGVSGGENAFLSGLGEMAGGGGMGNLLSGISGGDATMGNVSALLFAGASNADDVEQSIANATGSLMNDALSQAGLGSMGGSMQNLMSGGSGNVVADLSDVLNTASAGELNNMMSEVGLGSVSNVVGIFGMLFDGPTEEEERQMAAEKARLERLRNERLKKIDNATLGDNYDAIYSRALDLIGNGDIYAMANNHKQAAATYTQAMEHITELQNRQVKKQDARAQFNSGAGVDLGRMANVAQTQRDAIMKDMGRYARFTFSLANEPDHSDEWTGMQDKPSENLDKYVYVLSYNKKLNDRTRYSGGTDGTSAYNLILPVFDILYRRGSSYIKGGDLANGMKDLNSAQELLSGSTDLMKYQLLFAFHVRKGRTLTNSGFHKEALSAFNDAMVLQTTHNVVKNNLSFNNDVELMSADLAMEMAHCMVKIQDYERALDMYDLAYSMISIDKSNVEKPKSEKKYDKQMEKWTDGQHDSSNKQAKERLAFNALKSKLTYTANKAKVLRLSGSSAEADQMMKSMLEEVNAANVGGMAITLTPKLATLHQMLAFGYIEQKNYAAAIEEFKKLEPMLMILIPNKNTQFNDIYAWWGNALVLMKEYDKALEKYDKAIGNDPMNADNYKNRALCFAAQGKMDAAKEDFAAFALASKGIKPKFKSSYALKNKDLLAAGSAPLSAKAKLVVGTWMPDPDPQVMEQQVAEYLTTFEESFKKAGLPFAAEERAKQDNAQRTRLKEGLSAKTVYLSSGKVQYYDPAGKLTTELNWRVDGEKLVLFYDDEDYMTRFNETQRLYALQFTEYVILELSEIRMKAQTDYKGKTYITSHVRSAN